MLIALDYDGTYTEDPELWHGFSFTARLRGHTVMVVTMRHENDSNKRELGHLAGKIDGIVYTGRNRKKDHMASLGYYPDIWIDDKPHLVFHDAVPQQIHTRKNLKSRCSACKHVFCPVKYIIKAY